MPNYDYVPLLKAIATVLFAGLISFTLTPLVRVFAYKIGAIDVPRDDRRMHDHPIPRMGGLAIFAAFTLTTMIFCEYSPAMLAIWFGGLMLAVVGILDDVFQLRSLVKLAAQFAAAFVAVSQGLTIEFINIFGHYITLGWLEIPITLLWIVGMTNAINLIDGLDGLSCGVSVICSLSLMVVTLTVGDLQSAMVTAVLAAACLGFLPYNSNPAKIFMGDTGALFLGYTFAVMSIQGVFKLHAVLSFVIPLSIFGLPLFDTSFAFLRRILHGKNPFIGDRGHIHHRLIDMGLDQKHTVRVLYSISGVLGTSAVMMTGEGFVKAIAIVASGIVIFALNFIVLRNPQTRELTGLVERKNPQPVENPGASGEASASADDGENDGNGG